MLPLPTRRDYIAAHANAVAEARKARRPADAAWWLGSAARMRRLYAACQTEAQRAHINQMLRQQLQA